jgi:signal transduction histidine kinase
MRFGVQETYQKLARLLVAPTIEPSQRAARIQSVEKDVVLPLRILVIAILGYFFFLSGWGDVPGTPKAIGYSWIRIFFWFYLIVNLVAGASFIWVDQMSLKTTQRLIFSVGFLDVILITGLAFITDGWDSPLYWMFAVLILHNALAIPLALPQILLNLLAIFGFMLGGLMDKMLIATFPARSWLRWYEKFGGALAEKIITEVKNKTMDYGDARAKTSLINDRLIVLFIWAACCYGIQVLFERQRRAEAEATEFAVRQERLRTAGRLAAEIAHKIKNPLGIITNAAFCLQRAVDEGQLAVEEQISIIREEVEKADQILTELMGYSQLAEGRVERLKLAEELDDAIQQVFPAGAKYGVSVQRDYCAELPAVLMQKQHLASILVNLLQNAREALSGVGEVRVSTRYGEHDAIVIAIADNGPGIPPDKIDKIFEAYFTTRAKGTGLGLAIVKHNTEMYGGAVRVESEPGRGSCFTLEFPARILMRLTT